MTLYYCPECKESLAQNIEGTDIWYCGCGMTFRTFSSDIRYTVSGDKKEKMREIMDSSIQFYHRKNDDAWNDHREFKRQKAIDTMLEELLKGPMEGGTMAPLPAICSDFGTMTWTALQSAVLLRDEMCMICGQKPSKEVHHIRPRHLKGHDHPRNLIGLCLDCHDEVHRKIDEGIQKVCEESLHIRPVNKFQTTLDIQEGKE